MQERLEGTKIPEGFSVTITTASASRLHINYRRRIGDKELFIHLAIPKNTILDLNTWSITEDIFEGEDYLK